MHNKKLISLFNIILFLSSLPIWAMERDEIDNISSTKNINLLTNIYYPSLLELSQFSFLKTWDMISAKEQTNWEEKYKEKTKRGLEYKISGDKARAKQYFLEAAQEGSPQSMSFLGDILSAEGNNIEAFYWHRLAMTTSFLKGKTIPLFGNKLKGIAQTSKCPEPIKKYIFEIERVINSEDFLETLESLKSVSKRAVVVSDYLFLAKYDCLLNWQIMESQYTAIATLANEGSGYFKVADLYYASKSPNLKEKAAKYYLKSKTPEGLWNVGCMILSGEIDKDENGELIPEGKRDKVVARLCRKSKTPEALYHLAILIEEGKVHEDEKNKLISKGQQYGIAARLYREAKTPEALYHLGLLIENGRIHRDEEDRPVPEGQQYEVAAQLYRKASTPEALYNIAGLIEEGRIHRDEEDRPVLEGQQYEVAAQLYRKASTPTALSNLALLIHQGRIHKDEKNKLIPEGQQYEVAASLYRKASTSIALSNLALLIHQGRSHKDEEGQPIPEGQQYEVAASLYRKASTPTAKNYLALLIEEGRSHKDEEGQPIPEGQQYEVAASLYRKASTPAALINLAGLIQEGRIHRDEKNRLIPEGQQDEVVARLCREASTPVALYNIAMLILKGRIHKDEKNKPIPEGQQFEVAASLFRKAGTSEARTNLGRLIEDGRTHKDEKNKLILKGQQDEVAARIYRESRTPEALHNLAILIEEGRIHKDEKNKPIPEGQQYEVIASLYRKAGTPEARTNLGLLIANGRIHRDDEDRPILEGQQDEVAARIYRESRTPEALNNLALLIVQGRVYTDEENQPISKENKYEVVDRLYKQSATPLAHYNLAILNLAILKISQTNTLENKKKALRYALQAAQQGKKEAMKLYELLKADFETKETAKENSLKTSGSPLQNKTIIEEEALTSSSELAGLSLSPMKIKDSTEVSQIQGKESEMSEKASPLPAVNEEEEILSLETRKQLKKLKKLQRFPDSQKKKAYRQQEKLQKLINGELSKQERDGLFEISSISSKRKISFEWTKEAIEQFTELTTNERKKVSRLLKDLKEGIPGAHREVLRHESGKSRRITKKYRLVYRERGEIIEIISCKGHYRGSSE